MLSTVLFYKKNKKNIKIKISIVPTDEPPAETLYLVPSAGDNWYMSDHIIQCSYFSFLFLAKREFLINEIHRKFAPYIWITIASLEHIELSAEA